MPDNLTQGVLKRKIELAGEGPDPGAQSCCKLYRLALARAAHDGAGLLARVTGFSAEQATLDDLAAAHDGRQLVFLAEGGGGALGLAVLDGPFLAALIEQLTTGRVVPAPAPERSPTPTDAAVAADFLQRLFAGLGDAAATGLAAPPASFRPAAPLKDGPAVLLALEDRPYRRIALTAELGGGAKTGQVHLVFPERVQESADAAARARAWARGLRANVCAASVTLEAVLHRLSLPLEQAQALAVGSELKIPRDSLGAVVLEGAGGAKVGVARLGKCSGFRAVRLLAPPAPAAHGPAPGPVAASAPGHDATAAGSRAPAGA